MHVGDTVSLAVHQKRAESDKISADIARFEAAGGVIQVMKFGERDRPHLSKKAPRGAAKNSHHSGLFAKNGVDKPLDTLSMQELAEEEAAGDGREVEPSA